MTTATPFNITEGDASVQVFSMFNAGYNSPAANEDTNYVTAFNVNTGTQTFSYNAGNATGNGHVVRHPTPACAGKVNQEPWGSWGYQTGAGTNSASFSHTYLKIAA